MDCESCGHVNREGAKFCAQCAAELPITCGSCGTELGPNARFCDQCGSAVGPAAETAETAARKVVTILFADLVGSTSFGERVDAESARDVMAGYHVMARESIEGAGGIVAKFIGDGVMALFGVPETAEDDAARAVAAGLALQRGFGPVRDRVTRRHGAELGLRVGINTGEIVLADGDTDLVGDAINTAARLEAACAPGEILVGEETWRLTRSHVQYEVLGKIEVKGKHEPVATYRVVEDDVGDGDQATPFVGRADELAQLRSVLEEATDRRVARLVTVIGAPGVGKTRISAEFCESLGDSVTVAVLRCERAGTATFAPIADLLRSVTGIDDETDPALVTAALRDVVAELADADRVAELLASFVGVAPARSTEEAFLAVRRLVEAVGRHQPLVVVIDDIQWAEPLFLELLEHLAEWVREAPAVLVALARPELRDLRPAFAEPSRWLAATIALEGLDAAATAELAARLVGTGSLPSELVARLPDSTEGNPLFVRELMRMLVDDGVIDQTADGWQLTIDADAVEVPPTIQSLLAARLDRMPGDERRLVELASVVGSEFALGAVAAVAGGSGTGELRRSLERLRRRELIESTGTYWGDEPIYRFHHVLIRDAAYRRLLKRERVDLHLRVGEWTERTASELPGEHEVAIAHHYEQAHEYRRQLDDVDEQITSVGRRAAELLGAAAERSLERDDLAAASTLAERALARIDEGDPKIPALLVLGAEALLALGDVVAGRSVVVRLSELAVDDLRLAPWAECFAAQLLMLTEPDRLHDAEQEADRAATKLAALDDEAGVAKARLVRAGALARLGRIGQCEAELDLALTAARSAGDRRRVAAVLGAAPVAALWGPSPIPRAGGRCLDVIRLLRITTGSPAVEATSTRCQAVLEALRGRFDTARSMLADSRATVEELGLRHGVAETDLYTGIVELLAGEPAVAEPPLRAAYHDLGRLGIGADAGQAAAYLALALLRQGRPAEAEELATRSAESAGENPQTAITARTVQAEILAARGDVDQAVAAAAEAVAQAEGTDIIVDHANACAVLARVSRMAGDDVAADRAASTARALYKQKAATADLLMHGLASIDGSGASLPSSSATLDDANSTLTDLLPEDDPQSGSAEPEHVPWNEADRLARRGFQLFVDPALGGWEATLAANHVSDDRRRLVAHRVEGRDEMTKMWGSGGRSEDFALTLETIATRGDHHVLTRATVVTGGAEFDFLHLGQWTDGGVYELEMWFDIEQLGEAVAELDRLYLEELGDSVLAIRVREFGRGMALLGAADVDGFIELHDPAFVMRDHRLLGWPDRSLDEYRERMDSIVAVAVDAIVFQERVLRFDHTLSVCAPQRIVFTTPGGPSQVSRSIMVMIMDPHTGLITLMEQFEEDQVDEAVARFDELMAERGPVLHNEVSERASFVNAWLRRGDDELVGDALAHDAVLIDEHGEPLELAAVDRREVVAVRGDRLALVQLTGPGHAFAVEEIDAGGRLVAIRHFTADGLLDAAVHLDRRWLEIAGEEVLESERVVTQYRIAMNENDVARLAELLADDHALVDHRPFGWPTLDQGGVLLATAPDQTSATPEVALIVSEIVAAGQSGTLGRITLWTAETDGTTTQGMIGLSVVEVIDGRVGAVEVFGEDDFQAAMTRFDELAGAEQQRFALAVDDSPNAAVSALHRDPSVTVIDVLMALGDSLCLCRVERDGTAELLVAMVDDLGKIVETVVYESGGETGARRDVSSLWLESLASRRRDVAQLGASLGEYWVAPGSHLFDELLAPEFELLDGRTLGMGRLDGGAFEEALRGQEGDGATGPPLVSRASFVADDVMVFRAHNAGVTPESGAAWEKIACNVLVVRGGRVARLEMFDESHWDEAMARARHLARPARRLENAATRHRDTYIADGGGPGAFTDDYVHEDRRTVVSGGLWDRFEFMAGLDFFSEHEADFTLNTLAIRGERFSLFSVRSVTDDFVLEYLMFNELAEDGRLHRNVIFDVDDVHAALVELDRSWAATVPDSCRQVLQVTGRYAQAVWNEDAEAHAALVGDDFVGVHHRPLSFDQTDRQFWIQHRQQRFDEGTTKIIVPEILHLSAHVMAMSFLFLIKTDSGVEWEEEVNAVVVIRGEMIVREEVFGEEGRDLAIRRSEELEAEESGVGGRRLENSSTGHRDAFLAAGGVLPADAFADDVVRDDRRTVVSADIADTRSATALPVPEVQRLGQRVVDRTADGDFAAVRDCFEQDFVRIDRRKMIGLPDMNRDEYVGDLRRQWELGWQDFRTVGQVAVRDNAFVALLATDFDGGSESPYVVLLVEGSTRRIGRLVMYDEGDMLSALDDLDEAWLATLAPAAAETYRIATAQYSAYVELDRERLEALTADDHRFVDNRRLGNFGDVDRAGFFEMFDTRRETRGPGVARSVAVHRLGDGILVWSTEEHTTNDAFGGHTTSSGVFVVCVANGRVFRAEIWDHDRVDAALARGHALAGS